MRRSAAVYHKFTEDEIRQANSVDILSLARGYGYEPEKAGRKAVHMKHSGGLYIFPENNRFFQWTGPDDGIKGGAIDFVMREENLSFPEAVGKLIGKEYAAEARQVTPYEKKERGPLELPDRADNMKRAYGMRIREATKQGYAVARCGDSINLAFPDSKTRRGRVRKDCTGTLETSCNHGTPFAGCGLIRRLTPRECWRLQGFSDEMFDRARAVNSDNQLYRQAGNSVTIQVVYAVGRQILAAQEALEQGE